MSYKRKKLNNLEDLTIIIPTQLKKENLKTLDFIIKGFKEIKIIIITEKKSKLDYSNVKIYISKKKDLCSKIILGLNKVKTKNILLLPDDEFPIFNSIKDIYLKYKKNRKISSAIGLKYYFNDANPKVFYPINHHSYDYYNKLSVVSIEDSIKYYSDCYWGFHRTKLLKNFFKDYKKYNFYDLFFMEYKIILFMKIFGKVHYFKIPWSFRIKKFKKWPKANKLYNLANYKKKFSRAFETLSNYYNEEKKINLNSKKIFYEAFRNFIITPRPQDILQYLKGLDKLVFFFKKIFYIYFFQKSYYYLPQLVDRYYIYYLNKKNFSRIYSKKYINDYIEIIHFVLKNNILKIYQ